MPIPLSAGVILRERYKVRRVIGQGGMGCIYLADDTLLEGRQCALKEVEIDQSLPEEIRKEARQQFLREATVLARLDHPNLPKVSDFFSIENRDYLVMDYVPGKDLRTLVQEAKEENRFIPEESLVDWAHQLANALMYMHSQQPAILHRDIKPSNLKVTPDGLVKLVDFGLVKLLAPGEVTVTIMQGQGTALYTPLEQYGGDTGHTDVQSDIYSFGATMYHLATNEPPLDARERFLHPDEFIMPRRINPDLTQRMERAILWAMSLHPSDRPNSVTEFYQSMVTDRISRPVTSPIQQSNWKFLSNSVEQGLIAAALGLTVISLLITLIR
ncbi:MAG TPA: serine/threonine-protein kinase [Bellilinea sp.]|nr:serine/threonine-protein kinase [Bellilinea sp.]